MKWLKTGIVLLVLLSGMGIVVYEMSLLSADKFSTGGESQLYIFFSAAGAFLCSLLLVQAHEIHVVPKDVHAAARIKVGLYGSLFMNALFAGMQLYLAVINRNLWFLVLSGFYSVLVAIRMVLARQINTDLGMNLVTEYKLSRLVGVGLMVLNCVFSMIVFYIAHRRKGFEYPTLITLFMIGYTAYIFFMSLYNLFKFRKCGSPILYALMLVNFTFSLTAILTLETALIFEFDAGIDPSLRQAMTGITGAIICSIVWIIAFFMILDANAAIKKLNAK